MNEKWRRATDRCGYEMPKKDKGWKWGSIFFYVLWPLLSCWRSWEWGPPTRLAHVWNWHNGSHKNCPCHPLTLQFLQWFLSCAKQKEKKREKEKGGLVFIRRAGHAYLVIGFSFMTTEEKIPLTVSCKTFQKHIHEFFQIPKNYVDEFNRDRYPQNLTSLECSLPPN